MAVLDGAGIAAALRQAEENGAGRQALLQLAADRIRAAGSPYTSAYLYMLHGQELVLEAFSGRETDHTRIPVGKGVCGTAVATGRDQNVPDVRAIGNYLACNLETRSELVVLIRR
ncbi:MAG: GAF domain-containing protein, partial [Gemmatimonadales bacterium]